jgi:hypothetical protein
MTPINIEPLVRGHIKKLRRSQDVGRHWPALKALVEENQSLVLQKLSLRWLKSICDTYVDFGDATESGNALAITMFINMLRFAETGRFIRGAIDPEKLKAAKSERFELYEGLKTLKIDDQDTLLNVSKRMKKRLKGSGLMEAIWSEVLRRVHQNQSAVAELRDCSENPERFFPVDPTSMADNYGVI